MSIYSNAYTPPTNDANTILRDLECDPSVQVGDAVRVSGGVIVRALADTFANANLLGICESKTTATVCDVRVSGVSEPIYSGLLESEDYYLSDTIPGKIVPAPPLAVGSILIRIGQPFDAQRLTVIKGTRIKRG